MDGQSAVDYFFLVDWRVTRLSVDGVTDFSVSPGLLWDCSCRNRSGVRLLTSMGSSGGGMTGGGSALVGSAGRIFGVLESWISSGGLVAISTVGVLLFMSPRLPVSVGVGCGVCFSGRGCGLATEVGPGIMISGSRWMTGMCLRRYLRFLKVTLPDPSTRMTYWS